DTGPLTHTVSYDYVDARNAITDTPLPRRSKQMAKYQLDWDVYAEVVNAWFEHFKTSFPEYKSDKKLGILLGLTGNTDRRIRSFR
ncbi:hypothetical protein ONJ16_26040, partial [Salmonella enterica subsp. enterica serovar Montevideo]|nr:hypothetical protein [Salmonella enterica subsp. enterica serovar Montevideo]